MVFKLEAEAQRLRAPFPYLRERIYLDTAAAGLTWQGHGSAVARFYDEVKSRGMDARPEWQATTQRVRARLARWLAVSPEDITFVSNTTEGLNLAAHSIRWRAGDRIVLAADEFPSLARAWEPARRAGAALDAIDIGREEDRESALLAALGENTRVLAVSQTHWSTGTTVDLDRLAAQCRARDALLVVDGMQALGAVPTNLSHVDVYAASFFKWMLSGFGVGMLVTSPRARAAMEPAYRGYANEDDPSQLQYAHVNLPAMYGLDATLDFLEGIGWPTIFARVRALGDHLVQGAASRGLRLATPESMRAGIFAFRCGDAEAVQEQLAARGISAAARGDFLRLSPHFYNGPGEIDACLDALVDLITDR
jgi:cysteine desulfurase/selenocysteine lyase